MVIPSSSTTAAPGESPVGLPVETPRAVFGEIFTKISDGTPRGVPS